MQVCAWRCVSAALTLLCAATLAPLHGAGVAYARDAVDDDSGDSDGESAATGSPRILNTIFSSKPAERISYELLGGVRPDQLLLFGGFDTWRHGLSAYGGLQWSPDRFLANRLFLRMTASETFERFATASKTFTTQIFRGAVLSGILLQRERLELQIYAGPDSQFDVVRPDDLFLHKRGLRFGARAGFDAWWQPTLTTMLSGSLAASSIGPSGTARLAAGIFAFDRFWIGPEVLASADEFSKQMRVGAHITGLRVAASEWSAATGLVYDSYGRSGLYGRIGLFTRY